jgi:hypothetical protein
MSLRRSWLPLSLVFLAGALAGLVGAGVWVHAQLGALHAAGPEQLDDLALRMLDRELDLDAAQEPQAREVLHEVHGRLADFHRAHGEELHAILRDGATRLNALLRPEQVPDWAELHERMLDHLLITGSLRRHGAGAHGAHGDGNPPSDPAPEPATPAAPATDGD